jgi:hypothetical protein
MRRVAALVLLLALTACSAEPGTPAPAPMDAMPDDFAGTIVFRKGSVPPPYHYSWEVRFDEDSAEVVWQPGYDEAVPAFRESVPLDREQRELTWERLRAAGQFEPLPEATDDDQMVGGPTAEVEVMAGGRTYTPGTVGEIRETADMVDAVEEAGAGLFPAEVWESVAARQQAWSDQQPE